jgi:hypothetical protein
MSFKRPEQIRGTMSTSSSLVGLLVVQLAIAVEVRSGGEGDGGNSVSSHSFMLVSFLFASGHGFHDLA